MDAVSILLIEDEGRIRNNLELLLRSGGYRVTSAATGREGLAHANSGRFRVIVTDLIMEGFEGFELLEQIHAIAPSTPIVVITGNTSTLGAQEAKRRGACDYLSKPFSIAELRDAIARRLADTPPT